MTTKYEQYRAGDAPLPEKNWAWNMYGAGVDNIGRDGRPEPLPVPEPAANQILVRVDSVGMCFSDLKLVKQGGGHPKLYNRNLAEDPTRLGHEASLTVIKVGQGLQDQYYPGQRLAVQPDIYQNGKCTAYGYAIPGGLIQFHLIGPEVLETDAGACLLPLEGDLGYAEASLLEPWGCVMAAYTQRRRLVPQAGGTMWIVGCVGDETLYEFSSALEAPGTIVLTDVPSSVVALVERSEAQVVVRDGVPPQAYRALSDEFTAGRGFDDVVVLDPRSADMVSAAARLIARYGTFNLVGRTPLDGKPQIDVGRLHYDYTAYVGNRGPDVAASYGPERNRCELHPHGVALFIGAGGPMGQMHVQRAIELHDGPRLIIATEIDDVRLATLERRFAPLAKRHGRELLTFNPNTADESLADLVMRTTRQLGADDVVVCVPVAPLMAEAAALMNPNGMLVLFAGVPNGTMAPLDLSAVYLHNAQFTGTSGLNIEDQALVMRRTLEGSLSPARSVAAIGGMDAARDGILAMMEGRFPGKIVILPQINGLPLTGLDELQATHPDVAAKLDDGNVWTAEAEQVLVEKFWTPHGR